MKKLKHSKYKNTGIIFEILSRGIVLEAMDNSNSTSLDIVKKYFKEGTELYNELKYYQALQEIKPNLKNTDKLIDLVIETYNKNIDTQKLGSEKYRLIGEIKKKYDLDTFFNSRVSNYKLLASIYKILEHSASDNPSDHMNCRDVINEHISGEASNDNILSEVQTVWKNEDPDVRKIIQKIIIEKFNTKYQGLNNKQKVLLNRVVNEDTSSETFRDYIYEEVASVRTKLTRMSNGIDNAIMRIKLTECIGLMDMISSAKVIKNEHLSALLKYYELIEELS
jgi:hypothetical protein